MPVHPRPRGEHHNHPWNARTIIGSSPPTRGTRGPSEKSDGRQGFIPAHAGNTEMVYDMQGGMPVHPRPRGEHDAVHLVVTRQLGSSPPTRGTRCGTPRRNATARFIPAHAGNTSSRCSGVRKMPVHPRPRGEHHRGRNGNSQPGGSSPPTRGTLPGHRMDWLHGRFIPAHAGNTQTYRVTIWANWVHPRPRGEHVPLTMRTEQAAGSSPPTRGTHHRQYGHVCPGRFIPAHAGNTSRC